MPLPLSVLLNLASKWYYAVSGNKLIIRTESAIYCIGNRRHPMISNTRRAFLSKLAKFAGAPLLCGGGAFGFGSLLERHRVEVERHEIKLALGERAPAKLRALTMGDFHFDPLYEADYVAQCVSIANSLKPDVIFLTGDYVTSKSDRIGEFAGLLSKLCPRSGIFACLGNHDHWSNAGKIMGALESAGVRMLVNQQTRVNCAGGELVVAGLQSVWAGKPDWSLASRGLRRDERAVVLVHEPDFARTLSEDRRIALQLSGHTHGGQVRVPFYGALRLPTWGRLFQSGIYDLDALKLHVNRGIGTITFHVRLFCPPEIACFDISNIGAADA